ncbi:uncharacterized protein H6S33_004005 [Morchella sextelata]|uniref:uncharacterized protein n=1 Tax=Morchella sextelata TaxID=1174677 RepID=UPI001D0487A4|nr:uncharacterized protein H6S33_004005 [Morchella sextelata]KAH0606344.1 hypothetical protein H6S33_004005 [Morchella sextelata]
MVPRPPGLGLIELPERRPRGLHDSTRRCYQARSRAQGIPCGIYNRGAGRREPSSKKEGTTPTAGSQEGQNPQVPVPETSFPGLGRCVADILSCLQPAPKHILRLFLQSSNPRSTDHRLKCNCPPGG